jgi:carbon monoxide dehydrogenase subunit G
MASIRKEFIIEASADTVWDAVRDVGQVHKRLVPSVLTDARLEDGARLVSFANGMVVRELIVDLDDEQRRFAYAAIGGRTAHHNASIQVVPVDERRCRLVWITDLLPDAMASQISALVEEGARAMKQTLEGTPGSFSTRRKQ